MTRCPISLTRAAIISPAYRAYAGYKRGITPSGRGLRSETAFYGELMGRMEALEGEAQVWYQRESEKKARRNHG